MGLNLKRALVTGARGQDGSLLANLLIKKGYKVIGLSERFGGTFTSLLGDRIYVKKIAFETDLLVSVLNDIKPHEIYHLSSRASSSQLFDDPIKTLDVNGRSVPSILEAIRKTDISIKFLYACSSEIFRGGSEGEKNTNSPVKPINAYGCSKAYGFNITNAYRQNYKLLCCSAVLFNHESIIRPKHFVTRKITNSVARIKLSMDSHLLLNNLSDERDWCSAKDVVRALWLMLQRDQLVDLVLGSGKIRKVEDVCEIAFSHLGLNYMHYVQAKNNERNLTDKRMWADIKPAHDLIGWKPGFEMQDWISEMVENDLRIIKLGLNDE